MLFYHSNRKVTSAISCLWTHHFLSVMLFLGSLTGLGLYHSGFRFNVIVISSVKPSLPSWPPQDLPLAHFLCTCYHLVLFFAFLDNCSLSFPLPVPFLLPSTPNSINVLWRKGAVFLPRWLLHAKALINLLNAQINKGTLSWKLIACSIICEAAAKAAEGTSVTTIRTAATEASPKK